jgi:hypothetical protein
LCNLPPRLQEHKIAWLTRAIEDRFGIRPTSFRAGRYGLDGTGASILQHEGYLVDSSVLPFIDYSPSNGPNFDRFPHDPYLVGSAGLDVPDPRGRLVEVPITVGYNRLNFPRAHAFRKLAEQAPLRHVRAVGLFDRMGLVQRIKFCPEQSDERQLKRLFDVRARQQAGCVVLMFHSSSLVAGGTPYVPDERAVQQLYQRLVKLFEYAIGVRQCSTCTLTEFARQFAGERRAA